MFPFDWIASLFSLPIWLPMFLIISGVVLGAVGQLIPIYKSSIVTLAIIMLLGGVYLKGRSDVGIIIKKEIEVIEKIVIQEKIITKEIIKYFKVEQKQQETKHEDIIKQITTKDDSMCTVPQSFVWLHNSSAENTVPDPAGRVDGTPSGIEISTIEKIIADNYNTYHKIAGELKALQKWVSEQEKNNP